MDRSETYPIVDIYWAAKDGSSDFEYEDAACTLSDLEQSGVSRYAVADGATESSFAGAWARSLAEAYCAGLLTGAGAAAALVALRQSWEEKIGQMSLAWFAEDKAMQGAFATLCGLTLCRDSVTVSEKSESQETGKWQAFAVGDSCLFQIREQTIIKSFPLENSSQFGCSPEMLCSINDLRPQAEIFSSEKLKAEGRWLSGDLFLLMTDALACWFLTLSESGQLPFDFVAQLADQMSFLNYVKTSRTAALVDGIRLKNDDVTLLAIRV